jgi:hypothetical protein
MRPVAEANVTTLHLTRTRGVGIAFAALTVVFPIHTVSPGG